MAKTRNGKGEPTVIKKYANRRLYDTGRSSYVTLDDLCEMVKEGHDFVVKDAKSGEDITRSVLTQIIVDQESKDENNLLPISFLRNLIGFYGDNVQSFVPNYLETTMEMLVQNQEMMQEQMSKSMEGMGMGNMPNMFPSSAPSLEDIQRKNMEMLEQTMKMFSPFGMTGTGGSDKS